MKEDITNIEAEMSKIDINELFQSIGIQTFFRMKAESKMAELKESNEELQKLLKGQVEPKS